MSENQNEVLTTGYNLLDATELEEFNPRKLWLVEHLWQRQGCGIIGGAAKGAKTWLSLDVALSVSSATPCLGRFVVTDPGPVLVHCAEGGQSYLKHRLHGMCEARGIDLARTEHPFRFVVDRVRIDTADGQARLRSTVEKVNPKLLLLDPLVRLHRVDEKSATQMAEVLGFLSDIQRDFGCAVIVVHHTAKTRRSTIDGQDLRGTGDLHAWGDSNLFLKKLAESSYRLTGEHRAAPSPDPIMLRAEGDPPVLRVYENEPVETTVANGEADYEAAVLAFLAANGPATVETIRRGARGSNQALGLAVQRLAERRAIAKVNGRWDLVGPSPSSNPT